MRRGSWDDRPCSRNARLKKTLVGRAQLVIPATPYGVMVRCGPCLGKGAS